MFKRICHTAITVTNLRESLDFYKKLGFETCCEYRDESVNITRLSLGDTEVEIFHYKHEIKDSHIQKKTELSSKLKQPGWQHIAIGTDDINFALSWAKKENLVPAEMQITSGRTGILYFFLKDPEGNFVEIIEDKVKVINE